MVTADARNSRRFNAISPYHAAGILHRHLRPFFMYPPMAYSKALKNIITDGLTNTMLLIGNPLVVTFWRDLSTVGDLVDAIVQLLQPQMGQFT